MGAGGGERAPVALCREPTEPAGETGGGKHTASQSSRRDGRAPQNAPGREGTGQRQAALSRELRGRKGRKNQGGTGQVFLPARLTAMLCHRKAEGSGVKGRYPFRPRGVTPDREECPLGQRFPIPPGRARPLKSRSAQRGGIFLPCAGARPGPSGQGLCLRGSSLSWG